MVALGCWETPPLEIKCKFSLNGNTNHLGVRRAEFLKEFLIRLKWAKHWRFLHLLHWIWVSANLGMLLGSRLSHFPRSKLGHVICLISLSFWLCVMQESSSGLGICSLILIQHLKSQNHLWRAQIPTRHAIDQCTTRPGSWWPWGWRGQKWATGMRLGQAKPDTVHLPFNLHVVRNIINYLVATQIHYQPYFAELAHSRCSINMHWVCCLRVGNSIILSFS